MSKNKKIIFITNDDGYISKGFIELRDALSKIARVIAVAPANEKSACGHGLSVQKPLELIKVENDFYKLDDGNPSDCVYVGMRRLFNFDTHDANQDFKNAKSIESNKSKNIHNLESKATESSKNHNLPTKPDLVISGINIGSNMGEDTTYSGTVAGAMEGAIHGIPSIAISQFINDDFSEDFKTQSRDFSLALDFIVDLASKILSGKYEIKHRKFLNVNVPAIAASACKGVRVTQLGYRLFNGALSVYESPRRHTFNYMAMNPFRYHERDNANNPYFNATPYNLRDLGIISDFEAINQGYISLTPMQLDSTSYEDIRALDSILKS
ncbi:5'/3'-nucleotidase SurE [Helicobacter saguini]|uniref:5'-nucleotidase SurE n=1 Tax=Helicobacter saguini TaxID=1548018 RepID=A0A6B0HSI4_9HELI|nr:5'/3'-nucleotidase SurE [Helicobacter saguini]MWV62103.1 5'/3'-nucleotidase SurE [Helicobacter saguini]MWV67225.1 5'/3'-nucleotidase SurE [Helicobacter saguini]MWV69578.1 5'/3'-nucleotidase SurE [Helicobacter saguini]MWV70872.1 5'/3'-nucleotidase SurE [Helicobacter saguini]